MFSEEGFIRRHKILTGLLVFLLLLLVWIGSRWKGPYRSYRLDFVKVGEGQSGVLEVGVAKRDITPNLSLYDTYNDVDNDNHYKPSMGWQSKFSFAAGKDTYNDLNHNGRFDAVWIAGFSSNRPAKGVHDPLWVRAIALRNNGVTVAMVTIDSIGIFQDKFIDIRKRIDPSLKVDHVIFSSTHNHEVPDTMGNWSGPIPTPGSFDVAYMESIKKACTEAVEEAVRQMAPSDMYCVEEALPKIEDFLDDSRKPLVYDRNLRIARFVAHGADPGKAENTIATLINWSSHPETTGGDNPLITSDFCGYLRDSVENGVGDPNGAAGIGGMCLYFQGMVGGLMTQLHITVPHRNGVDKFSEGTFEKTQALGENLALVALKALRGPDVWKNENPRLTVAAKTIYPPVTGLFRVAILTGLLHPGAFWPCNARTEVDFVHLGDLDIGTVPGELYPEIAFGGIEAPTGQDFATPPVEIPPLFSEMHGKMKMMFGLANDEIGYIIPKSQWDEKPPRAYEPKGQYGEQNSPGPDVAPVIHHELQRLISRTYEALPK